jgi:hypothetical protein
MAEEVLHLPSSVRFLVQTPVLPKKRKRKREKIKKIEVLRKTPVK